MKYVFISTSIALLSSGEVTVHRYGQLQESKWRSIKLLRVAWAFFQRSPIDWDSVLATGLTR